MVESCNFEVARLKKKKKKKKKKEEEEEEEEEHFGHLATFWFGTFVMLFRPTRHVVGHEALKNKW